MPGLASVQRPRPRATGRRSPARSRRMQWPGHAGRTDARRTSHRRRGRAAARSQRPGEAPWGVGHRTAGISRSQVASGFRRSSTPDCDSPKRSGSPRRVHRGAGRRTSPIARPSCSGCRTPGTYAVSRHDTMAISCRPDGPGINHQAGISHPRSRRRTGPQIRIETEAAVWQRYLDDAADSGILTP